MKVLLQQFFSFLLLSLLLPQWGFGQLGESYLRFEGGKGLGEGKHIVLVAGDDEYRSEESMPMLAKILSSHHGFKTTVLFPIDPNTGDVVPNYQNNIPGLEQLASADLVIVLIRFRELPDAQAKYLEDYLLAGKPIIGLRTSTHGFAYQKIRIPNLPSGIGRVKYRDGSKDLGSVSLAKLGSITTVFMAKKELEGWSMG